MNYRNKATIGVSNEPNEYFQWVTKNSKKVQNVLVAGKKAVTSRYRKGGKGEP